MISAYFDARLPLDLYSGAHELIIRAREFSLKGEDRLEDLLPYVKEIRKRGYKVSLEYDLIVKDDLLIMLANKLEPYLDLFHSLRVRDLGLIHYYFERTQIQLDLILDRGFTNRESHQEMKRYLGSRLGKILISPELPKNSIREFTESSDISYEILVFAPLVISYTPRPLLQAASMNHKSVVVADSLESPHKNFLVTESSAGTLVFHFRQFSLLSRFNIVQTLNLQSYCIDMKFENGAVLLPLIINYLLKPDLALLEQIKKASLRKTFQGFFSVNRTDKQFKFLTNNSILRSDEHYLGEVIEVVRDKHIALLLTNAESELKIGDRLKFITPDNKIFETVVSSLRTPFLEPVLQAKSPDLVLLATQKGVSIRTAVYKQG